MATASTSAPASHSAQSGARWWKSQRRSRQLLGMLYVAPTAIFVGVFFIAPLFLVARMSASTWPLLAGDKGLNFPDNYSAIETNALF